MLCACVYYVLLYYSARLIDGTFDEETYLTNLLHEREHDKSKCSDNGGDHEECQVLP